MKALSSALIAVVLLAACQKDYDPTDPDTGNPSGNCRLTRFVQGTGDPSNPDTVYLVKYDSKNRPSAIIDSTNEDTAYAKYDAVSGLLTEVVRNESTIYPNSQKFTYYPNGKLKEAIHTWVNNTYRYTLEYTTDNRLSKASRYLDPADPLLEYYTFEYDAAGNLVKRKRYDETNNLKGTETYTYTDIINPLQDLILFSFWDIRGLHDVQPHADFGYAGKYLVKSYSSSTWGPTTTTVNLTYGTDKDKQVSSSKSVFMYAGASDPATIFSRKYFYSCK